MWYITEFFANSGTYSRNFFNTFYNQNDHIMEYIPEILQFFHKIL